MKLSTLVAALALTALPLPALAQDEAVGAAIHASYALWGMMDAMVGFCQERAPDDMSIESTYVTWQAENILVEGELELAMVAWDQPDELADQGRAAGHDGILDMVRPATNPDEICATWKASTVNGDYDAETFLATHLSLIRERDGM